jgi:hypothetical protein
MTIISSQSPPVRNVHTKLYLSYRHRIAIVSKVVSVGQRPFSTLRRGAQIRLSNAVEFKLRNASQIMTLINDTSAKTGTNRLTS